MSVEKKLIDAIDVFAEDIHTLIEKVIKISGKAIPADYYNEIIINEIKTSLPSNLNYNQYLYFITDFFANKIKDHYYYEDLATIFAVYRLHLETPSCFSDMIKILLDYKDVSGAKINILNDKFIEYTKSELIDAKIDHMRDYSLDYFSVRTLERSYLTRSHEKSTIQFYKDDREGYIIERPQYLFMRVALAIWGDNLEKAFNTYDFLSNKYFTHATPTLFNSGMSTQQLSSCFLMHVGDSLESIFKMITDVARTIKWAGGIGINISEIRAKGSLIRGTNGKSDGIIPLCVLLNHEGGYINQGGKRNGSIALYLEPWHADILEFVELRSPTGDEKLRARDLFLALWIPDLFMQRLKEKDAMWSLMCPNECPGLVDSHGEKFNELYLKYEREGRARCQIKAIDLWNKILKSQIETGMPYMSYKDHANVKSNQKNLGTIRSSNLCNEIYQYSDSENTAVCNLASLCLPKFIQKVDGKNIFNYEKLIEATRTLVENLNQIIDINFYPTQEARASNMKNRPIGIGVQGLADVYNIMELPFGSNEAAELNVHIFETIYYGAITQSIDLAKVDGPYESFNGSPFSEGNLQFDLWGVKPKYYDWSPIRADLIKFGARNSLLTAVMPTATTSQIMSNSEAIEPYMSNIFVRSTLAGEFIVINKNLMKCLIEKKLWDNEMKQKLILSNGSIQHIPNIPQYLKDIYKTAFEIKQKEIIAQSIARGPFIDQSQSLNLFLDKPSFEKLSWAHFYGWANGIKTGMYYLRTQPAAVPINFSMPEEKKVCKRRPKGADPLVECQSCSA